MAISLRIEAKEPVGFVSDAETVRAAVDVVEEGQGAAFQSFPGARSRFVEGGSDLRVQCAGLLLDHRLIGAILATEMLVDHRLRHPGPGSDLLHRCAFETPFREHLPGDGEQLRTSLR